LADGLVACGLSENPSSMRIGGVSSFPLQEKLSVTVILQFVLSDWNSCHWQMFLGDGPS